MLFRILHNVVFLWGGVLLANAAAGFALFGWSWLTDQAHSLIQPERSKLRHAVGSVFPAMHQALVMIDRYSGMVVTPVIRLFRWIPGTFLITWVKDAPLRHNLRHAIRRNRPDRPGIAFSLHPFYATMAVAFFVLPALAAAAGTTG